MTNIVKQENAALVRHEPSIGEMLDGALKAGKTAGELKELLDLYERLQVKNAEQAFNQSLSAFQQEAKTITKNRQVDFVSQKGGRVKYGFADFEHLCDQIRPLLDKHGFAFSHDTAVDEKGMMTVACTLRHVGGHRESARFSCPTTAQTSLMSDQQRYAAALTFARRYTLIQILGLATGDPDPDDVGDPTTITDHQAEDLNDRIHDAGADIAKFKAHFGIEKLSDLRAADLQRALAMLAARKGKK